VLAGQSKEGLALSDVSYLLRRATFGRPVAEMEQLVGRTSDDIVNELLSVNAALPARPDVLSSTAAQWQKMDGVRHWWYDRMAFSGDPLREKMTLFLHGHFTSEVGKVGSAAHLWDQNQLFRWHAFGDLRALTRDVSLQPAMLFNLDNAGNVKEQPNENFARELWELFLLGPGNFSQFDVVGSSRAWTGHTTILTKDEPDSAAYIFSRQQHDGGFKTIFGATRRFDGPEVIDWTFNGPKRDVLARFFVTKLWRFFTGQTPSTAARYALAASLQTRWSLGDLLRTALTHAEFFAAATREPFPRSPADLIVNTMIATNLRSADLNPIWFAGRMGQELFNPPTVAGWSGGLSWHSATTFYGRVEFGSNAAYIADKLHGFLGATTVVDTKEAIAEALRSFGVVAVSDATRGNLETWLDDERAAGGWATVRHLIMLVLLSPEFQVA
jgi:uncharacterized protein (DUF1800 family)